MPTEFKLPEVSEGVESADIAEILISEGDTIDADQIVMEIETEKAAVDLPCPHAGKVAKIHVSKGETVAIGSVLLTIEESSEADTDAAAPDEGQPDAEAEDSEPEAEDTADDDGDRETEEGETAETAEEKKSKPPASKKETKQPAQTEKPKEQPSPKSQPEPSDAGKKSTEPAGASQQAVQAASASSKSGDGAPPPAGPATRRLARELGVDLNHVHGTGPGGRITGEDVKSHVKQQMASPRAAAQVADVPAALPDFSRFGPILQQPLNKIAKTSAQHLSNAWHAIPHVTQHDLVDVTDLEAARKRFLQSRRTPGPKITMTAIMVKACIAALKQYPTFNASLDPQSGTLIVKQYYHIGVAVDTDYGLLVPVIRDADHKTIVQIAAELTDIAERARNRKLDLSEMQGGTFTITNLGGIGGTAFTPIVNFPEVAILGMSRTQKQLQMIDGTPQERLMLPLSLSYDHRVVNGADAARFVVKLEQTLADHFQLLVEC